jgi:hypothetical protein
MCFQACKMMTWTLKKRVKIFYRTRFLSSFSFAPPNHFYVHMHYFFVPFLSLVCQGKLSEQRRKNKEPMVWQSSVSTDGQNQAQRRSRCSARSARPQQELRTLSRTLCKESLASLSHHQQQQQQQQRAQRNSHFLLLLTT